MNYQDVKKAHDNYEQIADLCDTIDKAGLWDKPKEVELTLRDVLQRDVAQFIMYLSASDGHLNEEEVQAYRAITGFGGDDMSSIKHHIEQENI